MTIGCSSPSTELVNQTASLHLISICHAAGGDLSTEIIVKSDYRRGFLITIHEVEIQCTRAVETSYYLSRFVSSNLQ